ncbi:MAG: acetolactate synthase large subunit [Pseudomonadales bacterium]
MTGAEALLRTLLDADINICFSNPGTSEMHFVAALDNNENMRCVLGLFEGVVTGAADGYARMAGKPAATLLHLGPGLTNAMANIHNAKRGPSAMVNVVGDHASYHLQYDAPLTSDVPAIAATMSDWVKTSKSADKVATDGAEAIATAMSGSGKIATLILPADVSWNETEHGAAKVNHFPPPAAVNDTVIQQAANALTSGEPCMILMGGSISNERQILAANICAHSSARLACETFTSKIARGAGCPEVERIPYMTEFALDVLKDLKHVILVGTDAPVSFFAYPNLPSELLPETCSVHGLASLDQDMDDALKRLSQALKVDTTAPLIEHTAVTLPQGDLNSESIAQSIAAQLPEHTVIVDEGIVGGMGVFGATTTAAHHDWILQTGGAIGWGLPAAAGAAIAVPDRKVVCLEGDGSAMYTIQALWTMARENLDVTTIIFANRQYAILQIEYSRVGAEGMGKNAAAQMSLSNPDINYVELATSMGVSATKASNAEEFNQQFAHAMATPGPHLIEAEI